ncbi:MAG: ECF transporter S component [Actinomycetia bacterium]|nr:ECF transporter S component [Actinomycetes bacterium]
MHLRGAVSIALVSIVGLAAFMWPLLVVPGSGLDDAAMAPLILAALLPLFLLVVLAEISRGGFDVKAIAMLGVLSAVGAILRPLGAGAAGLETVFFLLVLAGRVYGPGFGFVLGATTLLSSALLTGGVGPWLPFQMLAAAWVGLFAGLLPRARGRAELALLVAYGVVAGIGYGLVMNFSFWPFTVGIENQLAFVAGAPVLENLHRFIIFSVSTSLGWDLGRALVNTLAILLLGPAVLSALRRTARRAAFDLVGSGAPPGPSVQQAGRTRSHELRQ